MKQLTVDNIFQSIMLLSEAEKRNLYQRMQTELNKNHDVVAYSISGQPFTHAQYIEKINRAIAQADRGELLTDEELQKEIVTW